MCFFLLRFHNCSCVIITSMCTDINDVKETEKTVKRLEEENRKLVQELNKILGEVKEMEEDYGRAVQDLESSLKVHENN